MAGLTEFRSSRRREAFGEWHGRKVKLAARNFRLTDAARCPDAAPPAPAP